MFNTTDDYPEYDEPENVTDQWHFYSDYETTLSTEKQSPKTTLHVTTSSPVTSSEVKSPATDSKPTEIASATNIKPEETTLPVVTASAPLTSPGQTPLPSVTSTLEDRQKTTIAITPFPSTISNEESSVAVTTARNDQSTSKMSPEDKNVQDKMNELKDRLKDLDNKEKELLDREQKDKENRENLGQDGKTTTKVSSASKSPEIGTGATLTEIGTGSTASIETATTSENENVTDKWQWYSGDKSESTPLIGPTSSATNKHLPVTTAQEPETVPKETSVIADFSLNPTTRQTTASKEGTKAGSSITPFPQTESNTKSLDSSTEKLTTPNFPITSKITELPGNVITTGGLSAIEEELRRLQKEVEDKERRVKALEEKLNQRNAELKREKELAKQLENCEKKLREKEKELDGKNCSKETTVPVRTETTSNKEPMTTVIATFLPQPTKTTLPHFDETTVKTEPQTSVIANISPFDFTEKPTAKMTTKEHTTSSTVATKPPKTSKFDFDKTRAIPNHEDRTSKQPPSRDYDSDDGKYIFDPDEEVWREVPCDWDKKNRRKVTHAYEKNCGAKNKKRAVNGYSKSKSNPLLLRKLLFHTDQCDLDDGKSEIGLKNKRARKAEENPGLHSYSGIAGAYQRWLDDSNEDIFPRKERRVTKMPSRPFDSTVVHEQWRVDAKNERMYPTQVNRLGLNEWTEGTTPLSGYTDNEESTTKSVNGQSATSKGNERPTTSNNDHNGPTTNNDNNQLTSLKMDNDQPVTSSRDNEEPTTLSNDNQQLTSSKMDNEQSLTSNSDNQLTTTSNNDDNQPTTLNTGIGQPTTTLSSKDNSESTASDKQSSTGEPVVTTSNTGSNEITGFPSTDKKEASSKESDSTEPSTSDQKPEGGTTSKGNEECEKEEEEPEDPGQPEWQDYKEGEQALDKKEKSMKSEANVLKNFLFSKQMNKRDLLSKENWPTEGPNNYQVGGRATWDRLLPFQDDTRENDLHYQYEDEENGKLKSKLKSKRSPDDLVVDEGVVASKCVGSECQVFGLRRHKDKNEARYNPNLDSPTEGANRFHIGGSRSWDKELTTEDTRERDLKQCRKHDDERLSLEKRDNVVAGGLSEINALKQNNDERGT